MVFFRLCCIASVLAAKVIRGCEVTVGQESEGGGRWPHAATAAAIKQMGATHVKTEVTISFCCSLSMTTNFKHKTVMSSTPYNVNTILHKFE